MLSDCNTNVTVAVIGGGPAGLMAAEVLVRGGIKVDLFDAMPSVGRKFLLAGKGGMNLTHSEPIDAFLSRYRERRNEMTPLLAAFSPAALRQWVHDLGIETFVGSSGRVFPTDMKAAPLLRAWLQRLRHGGVNFHMRHKWTGWRDDGALRFHTPDGERDIHADTTILALGGASWARLGSDGTWLPWLAQRGIPVKPLQPSNCGFDTQWSEHFRSKFAGQPLKAVIASFTAKDGASVMRQGDCIVTDGGVEGSLIYALSAPLRDRIATEGNAVLHIDLLPGRELSHVIAEVARPRGSRSMSSHLQSRLGLQGVKAGLLRELLPPSVFSQPEQLAKAIKSLPLPLHAPRPIDEAISSAGGVAFDALDANLMLRTLPGIFCAGEMLDWEAPTGGYLLTGCFASGLAAGNGALQWISKRKFNESR
jgi:uncharacterized flavoprotein (TIGR03862 family)